MSSEPNQPERPPSPPENQAQSEVQDQESPPKGPKPLAEPVFPPGSYAQRIANYWKKYRPSDYQYMVEQGLAEKSFRSQGKDAEELQSRLIRDGLHRDQVFEIVSEEVFPLSEEEQPNLLEPPTYGLEPEERSDLEDLEELLGESLRNWESEAQERSMRKPPPPPEATP